jgi:hypothetical protein
MNSIILQRGTANPLRAFVDEARQARAAAGPPRLVFALDATASRQPTWDLACQLQGQMFQAAAAVGKLLVQLAYFRGEEFRVSEFVARADMLTGLMSEITCKSGHTQIGRVLSHVQREASRSAIAALVYVGDTTEEPASVLIRAAEDLGVRTFVFHEDPDANHRAVRVFEAIARVTGGVYLPFDRNSAGELAGLLAAIGAYAAGGVPALKNSASAAAKLLLQRLK